MTTIVLADDKKNIREFCKQELEDEGYRVILARDGREAIKLVRKERPDLVVLDLCMPRLGGLDAIGPIWAIAPEVPIILFTEAIKRQLNGTDVTIDDGGAVGSDTTMPRSARESLPEEWPSTS